ncbi:hypothetical protein H1C71_018338, partial [Ictidomys tridecemlineatus]
RSSQEVFLILLEQDLLFRHDIGNKACPVLLELSALDSVDEESRSCELNLTSSDCKNPLGLSCMLACAGLEGTYVFILASTIPVAKVASDSASVTGSSWVNPEPAVEAVVL